MLASPGSLDTTFDPVDFDGVLVTNLGLPSPADVRFQTVTTQADGKIIAAGTVDLQANNRHDFVVARFNSNGSLDTTFGVDGADLDALPDGFITFDFNSILARASRTISPSTHWAESLSPAAVRIVPIC